MHPGSRARTVVVIAGWLAAACLATAVGILSVRALGDSIVGGTTQPLTPQQVERALAQSAPTTSAAPLPSSTTSAPPQPSPTSAPTTSGPAPTATGVTRTLRTPGGTIVARCAQGMVTLQSWSPSQGYEAEDATRGPAATAGLKLESDSTEFHVSVTCRDGIPTANTSTDDDHGGHRGHGG